MNLGDGLLLQMDNGKPRLVLLRHGEKSGVDKQPHWPGLSSRPRGPPPSSPAPSPCSSNQRSIVTSRNSSKTPANHMTVGKTRAVSVFVQEQSRPSPRLPSSNRTIKNHANGRKGRTDALANGEAGLKKRLACPTNQQPVAVSKPFITGGEGVLASSTDQILVGQSPSTTETEENDTWLLPLRAPPPSIAPSPATTNGPGRGKESSGCGERASFLRSMTALLDPAEREERVRRRNKQLEQQRAIEAQLAERREQREREEMKKREDEEEEQRKLNDTWPLPLRTPPPALAPPKAQPPPPSLSTPVPHTPAQAPPPGPGKGEEPSVCGERASFVRSMTALLDPAEREQRERRRYKQLEQQRAIEAQLAERREQREIEEMKRREEEVEEHRKLKEQVELNTQQVTRQEGQLRSRKQQIREFSRSHDHVVTEKHNVSLGGPKGGQRRERREPTCNERRGGDSYQVFARTERTDPHRGLPAVRPPCPPSPAPEQDYFPYVRTADIIHLEPLDCNGIAHSPTTSTHCQKEMLQSLAALRQGLLQKQRELETELRLQRSVTSQRS